MLCIGERKARANPVQVNGTLVAAGGELHVTGFPIQTSLSDGAFELMLRPPAPSGDLQRAAGARQG